LYVTRPTLAAYVATREELEWRASEVMGWVAAGKLKISLGQSYRLAEAERAHRDLEGRKTTGKILLIP
jgi:NADPH2:quinone reductase